MQARQYNPVPKLPIISQLGYACSCAYSNAVTLRVKWLVRVRQRCKIVAGKRSARLQAADQGAFNSIWGPRLALISKGTLYTTLPMSDSDFTDHTL